MTTKIGLVLQGSSRMLKPIPKDEESDEEGTGSGEGTEEESDEDEEDAESSSGDADSEKEDGESSEESDGSEGDEDKDAGGHSDVEHDGIAKDLLEAFMAAEESGLLDNNSALKDAIGGEEDEEDVEDDEKVWRPFNPELDEVKVPNITENSKYTAGILRKAVRKETSALRNRMRSKFLQARQPKTVHGVRHGRDLSDRRLVSSVIELRSGRRPTRPDWRREKQEDVSLACAVVVDESWSMDGPEIINATKGCLVVADSLDMLGSPCLVVGPRDGGRDYDRRDRPHHEYINWDGEDDPNRYHRTSGVIIDVFKDWTESMTKAWGRFGRIQAEGSTPLSDGIQYGLQELAVRPERHRVVLVMTDGVPNNQAVVRRQIRKAAEAGIWVVGVGIGTGTRRGVEKLFPLNVCCEIADLPGELMRVLEGIVFPKRGKRLQLEGKVTARKKRA